MSPTYRFTGVRHGGAVRVTVCALKDGRLLEVRRGNLTGAALRADADGPRTWASVAAWKEDMLVADPDGTFCAATPRAPLFAPSPAVASDFPPADVVIRIRQMLDENAAAPVPEKPAAAARLMGYLLAEPAVATIIQERPRFGDTVRQKCLEFIGAKEATPALIAACGAVLGRWWPAELAAMVPPAPVVPPTSAPVPALGLAPPVGAVLRLEANGHYGEPIRSTAVVLKDGQLKELRRGELTGVRLSEPRYWPHVDAWQTECAWRYPEGKAGETYTIQTRKHRLSAAEIAAINKGLRAPLVCLRQQALNKWYDQMERQAYELHGYEP
ncbi:hypothetical protein EBZ80_20125 [bacterium]|nr:hypothetical protein [bacterium]